MDFYQKSLAEHRRLRGKLEIKSKMKISNAEELSIAYTPGVAEVSRAIYRDGSLAVELVATKQAVAVVTDGSAVLGLGDIGPEAALPVMEGKALLFKEFAGIDAWPIALGTQDVDEIVATVINIAPGFGGINLEDISAPRCFEIEKQLIEKLDMPVFHDDQHGTAIIVLAGLINSLTLVGKEKDQVKVVISGAGAAGLATAHLLHEYGFKDILVVDSRGIIHGGRDDLNEYKKDILSFTNTRNESGDLSAAVNGAEVFVGVSVGDVLTASDVTTMADQAIVIAMANPTPEIMPEEAKKGGAYIVATGRSDFPNQLNNVLVFPGVFKGAFEAGANQITDDMKFAAAEALAGLVKKPTPDKIIPGPFDDGVADAVAKAIVKLT